MNIKFNTGHHASFQITKSWPGGDTSRWFVWEQIQFVGNSGEIVAPAETNIKSLEAIACGEYQCKFGYEAPRYQVECCIVWGIGGYDVD